MVAKGYGEAKPLATNDDEKEGREINRRTEFEVIGKDAIGKN
jgi:outer membrane protein OmpA-like peptidoglycan-associated protein